MDKGHWTCSFKIPEDCYGFIYEITNLETNRKYIGKKQMLRKISRPPLKGKKRKRIDYIESDWKTYTGSSKDLNEDIEKFGKDKFKFEIIKTCQNKFELAYYETKIQFEREVLLREDYYNGIINCRIPKAPKKSLKKF